MEQQNDVPLITNGLLELANNQSGKSLKWTSRCGLHYKIRKNLYLHHSNCVECRRNKFQRKIYTCKGCKIELTTQQTLVQHKRICLKYQEQVGSGKLSLRTRTLLC